MTQLHMHYKACEMHPILKPVIVQNNAEYCRINRQTSFNSLLRPHGITANECCDEVGLETCIGDLGVTSFNSCPNPWLETASPLYWRWIRLDLTRSHSQPSARPVFPMLRSNYQFYMAPQFIPYRCQSIHPPPHCNKPILHEERDKKKPTSPPAPGEHFCVSC